MARTADPALEADRFMTALDDKFAAVDAAIVEARAGIARSAFAAYKRFSDATADFEGFCILIEYRIKKVPPGAARTSLENRLLTARTYAMSRMLAASIKLIGGLAGRAEFPLGAKEIFLRELRSLYALKNALSQEPYASRLSAESGPDVDLAEKILREIIDKAPTLLELSPQA